VGALPSEPLTGPTWRDRARGVLTSGRVWVWVHSIGAVIWIGLSWPGMTVWRNSITFVVMVSLYAIVLSHVVGLVAAIGARKADDNDPL
jgi:apolipoprotein N-acyltransferase